MKIKRNNKKKIKIRKDKSQKDKREKSERETEGVSLHKEERGPIIEEKNQPRKPASWYIR
jgi:hypothetical protein